MFYRITKTKKMRNIFIITFLCLMPIFVKSQVQVYTPFTNYKFYAHKNIEKVGSIRKKTLVVEGYKYSKSKLKRFKKKGVLDEKTKALKVQNDKLLKIVKENWTYNSKIVSSSSFTKKDEYTKSDKHIYLSIRSITDKRKSTSAGGVETTYSFSYSFMRVKGSRKMLGSYANSGGNFNHLELVTALKYVQKCFDASEKQTQVEFFPRYINQNAISLKNMTLLIPFNCTKLTIEKIREKYSFDVKFASFSEIADKIASKSSEFAYYLPQHQAGTCGKGFNHLIYSCENQEPIVLIEANKFKFGQFGGNASPFYEIIPVSRNIPLSKILRKKTFEKLNKLVAGI